MFCGTAESLIFPLSVIFRFVGDRFISVVVLGILFQFMWSIFSSSFEELTRLVIAYVSVVESDVNAVDFRRYWVCFFILWCRFVNYCSCVQLFLVVWIIGRVGDCLCMTVVKSDTEISVCYVDI